MSKETENMRNKELIKERFLKLLLRSFVLSPYRFVRKAEDESIKSNFKDFFKRDAKTMRDLLKDFNSLLDIGSGYGYFGDALQEVMPEARIVNADIVNNHLGKTAFILADSRSLPFRDNSFDIVTLFHVLHHTDQSRDVLREAKRVSRDRVVIQEDAVNNPFERLVSWLHIYTWQPEWPLSRITVRNDRDWQKLFEEESFTIKNKRRIHMRGLPITRYKYLLEQK